MHFNSDKIRTAARKLLQSLRRCAAMLLSMVRAAGRLMKSITAGLSSIGHKAFASRGKAAVYGKRAAAAAGKLPVLGKKISYGARKCFSSIKAGAVSLAVMAKGLRKRGTDNNRTQAPVSGKKQVETPAVDQDRTETPLIDRKPITAPAADDQYHPLTDTSVPVVSARRKKKKKTVHRAEGKYTKRRRRNLRERRLSRIAAGTAVLLMIMAAVFAAVSLFGPQMREPAEVSTSVSTEGNEAFRGEREGAEKIPFGTSFRGLTESSRENLSGIRRQMEESLREEYMQILDRGEGDSFHTASAAGNKLWKKVRRERREELQKDPLLILVNKWHYLPEDYEVEPVDLPNGQRIGSTCYEQLEQMLADCAEAGGTPIVCSGYRPHWYQVNLFDAQINRWLYAGCGQEEAEANAATAVAIPGTSEHELGLAADIYSSENMDLDESQVNTFTQLWLMKNSWRYGFVLRYPKDKSDITGIIFEPWHYRYVGKKHAKKIYDAGICLEEYLDQTQHP